MTQMRHRCCGAQHSSQQTMWKDAPLRQRSAYETTGVHPLLWGASPERLPNETPHNIAELGRCREDGNVALPVERAQLRIRETRRDFLGRRKCDEAILAPMGNQNRRRDGGEKRHDILRWIGVEET